MRQYCICETQIKAIKKELSESIKYSWKLEIIAAIKKLIPALDNKIGEIRGKKTNVENKKENFFLNQII